MSGPRGALVLPALLIVGLFSPLPGREVEDEQPLSLEQLMSVRVSSVQRKSQSVARTAAAVYVITREEIQRSGVSTVPEALRLAPGVHVARMDSGAWAISARGFTGQFTNKILILVDGRATYHPMTTGLVWDNIDLMLEDIERIEVIRGPAALIAGPNTSNGVVNIITRRASETVGGMADVRTGNEDRMQARVRYGKQARNGLAWRISGQYSLRKELERNLEPDEEGNAEGGEAPWRQGRVGLRLDWDRGESESVELIADFLASTSGEAYSIPMLSPQAWSLLPASTEIVSGNLHGRWTRPWKKGQLTMQLYHWVLHADRKGIIDMGVHTTDAEAQYRRPWAPGHELVASAGVRHISDHSVSGVVVRFDPDHTSTALYQATLQDEWSLARDRFLVSVGARFERPQFGGANIQPSARALWAIRPRVSLWGALSRTVRAPGRADSRMAIDFGTAPTPMGYAYLRRQASPGFGAERQHAYELGFRQSLGRVRYEVAGFYSRYRDYASLAPGGFGHEAGVPLILLTLGNDARGHGYGLEADAEVRLSERWNVSAAFTHYASRLRTGGESLPPPAGPVAALPDAFPEHQARIMSSYRLSRRWQANGVLYAVGAFNGRARVPAHQRLDANLQWRVAEWGGLSFGAQNLAGKRYIEFYPEDGGSLDRAGRSVFVRWQWWF